MTKQKKSLKGVRGLLLGTTAVLAGAVWLSAPAAAQEADDTIIVTGSRIARDPNIGATGPVQAIDADDILLSGDSNVADVLAELPALSGSVTGEETFGFSGLADGANVLQLRNLGIDRTLTLVNGRRHVGGVAGTQAVDVGSIPAGLVERVEVLTGGASAVYGSDAVTGVINFVLREDFEGLQLNGQYGVSFEGDGAEYNVGGLWGRNFAEGRGNITAAVEYSNEDGLTYGDRDFTRDNGLADDNSNPARRFQAGDLDPTSTPNFFANFVRGQTIPGNCASLGFVLTSAEQALCDRRATAPSRAILPQPTFSISSARGVIAPADFDFATGVDLNGNGADDCEETATAYLAGYGCWVIGDNGRPRVFQDGLIAGAANQFGGDGITNSTNNQTLTTANERFSINLLGRYEFTPSLIAFAELKAVYQTTEAGGGVNTFNDTMYQDPSNPFIPTELQALAADRGGLYVTRDNTDLGANNDEEERTTYRAVFGFRGELWDDWVYEVAANYGRFERESTNRNQRIEDRWFAAIDVVADASGNPICRSELTGDPPFETSPFPPFEFGFYTFRPQSGACVPVNLFGGVGGISQEAIDWVTTTTVDTFTLEQSTLTAQLVGDSSALFSLPAGPIDFAMGAEWRKEESTSDFDVFNRGIMDGSGDYPAGTFVGDVSGNSALGFDPTLLTLNAGGQVEVWEGYLEVSAPLIENTPFFEELRVDGAARYSEYDTIGDAVTWMAGVSWSPVSDIRFRATKSQAVRAPNIGELYAPDQGATFRPVDPCDLNEIAALTDPAQQAIRAANCAADGLPSTYVDPLTGRFSGVNGGNPNLEEETADTGTIGVIWQSRWAPGLTVTADYWKIEIDGAIDAVSAQDTVDNCYDSSTFPNAYCSLFTRNRDSSSPTFLGLNFLRQTQLNYGAIKTAGYDYTGRYAFEVGENNFVARVGATFVDYNDRYFDPADPTVVDPELGEIRLPEWSGTFGVEWTRGPYTLAWNGTYQGTQALRAVEIETAAATYGPAGIVDSTTIHDIAGRWQITENAMIFGGIQNVGNARPFATEPAWPVSPVGRFLFVGSRINF